MVTSTEIFDSIADPMICMTLTNSRDIIIGTGVRSKASVH